jgi:hypothetical protein
MMLFMRSVLHTLVALVAAGKSNLSGWYVLLALLFLSVLMSGCAQHKVPIKAWAATTVAGSFQSRQG